MIPSAENKAAEELRRLDEPWDSARLQHGLEGLRRRRQRRRLTRVGLMLAAPAAVAMFFLLRPSRLGPPAPPPQLAAPSVAPMHLGDGSTIFPDERARVILREVSPLRVRVALEAGRARFEVAPRTTGEFSIEAGPVQVIVVGTQFTVERLGDHTRVGVTEGHVRVVWGDEDPVERHLHAGDEGLYPDVVAVPPPSPPTEAPAEPTHHRTQRPHPAPTREWRHLAQEGGYREAYDLLVAGGPASVRDDVDDLLLAADAARLSGHPGRALPYLDRLVAGHASDDRAPMAAFTRARIYMTIGRPGEAAESFERAISLGARGSLHENALARAVEAHSRNGDTQRAATLARTYCARYPAGRWLASVRANGGLDE